MNSVAVKKRRKYIYKYIHGKNSVERVNIHLNNLLLRKISKMQRERILMYLLLSFDNNQFCSTFLLLFLFALFLLDL